MNQYHWAIESQHIREIYSIEIYFLWDASDVQWKMIKQVENKPIWYSMDFINQDLILL